MIPPLDRRRFLGLAASTAIASSTRLSWADDEPDEPMLDWHDVQDWGVEGKGWDDTAKFFDRLPARAEETVRKAVWEREESMSTGMQYGIAIPHGRTDAVSSMACVVGMKREGIDWDSLDGEPSTIFVMVISPSSSSGPHVRFLSVISQVLNKGGREALLVRSQHPRAAKVLVDRPDRVIEVGIDRATGFLLSLTERVGDDVTHHAEVTELEVDPTMLDSAFELKLPADVRKLY